MKDSTVTSSETKIAGTFDYMAPEQLMGKPSASSDIYTLAIIVYEMLTMRRPFKARTSAHLFELQRAGVQIYPRTLRSDLPEAAESVILKALSFEPQNRYKKARDFTDELEKALTGLGPQQPPAASAKLPFHEPVEDSPPLETAHVLCLELTEEAIDKHEDSLNRLEQLVRNTPEFVAAQAEDRIFPIPLPDGMALLFFGDVRAPVVCARQISKALKDLPALNLRMGIHTGNVHRSDFRANRNITGGGINVARDIMAFGDAGHVLLSDPYAKSLNQLRFWQESLHDLGEQEIRPGVSFHIFSFYNKEFGNPRPPDKLRSTAKEKKRIDKFKKLIVVASLLMAGIVGIVMWKLWTPGSSLVKVTLNALPWARVKIIPISNGIHMPQLSKEEKVTPCYFYLPQGEYRVELSRDNGQPLVKTITVRSTDIGIREFEMPGYDTEKAIQEIFE